MRTARPSHVSVASFALAGAFALALVPLCAASAAAQSALIVDHRSTSLAAIPEQWIVAAKSQLHIAYGHTSHGSQLVDGMYGLVGFKGPLYSVAEGGTDGALDLRDTPFSGAYDLGNPNWTAWAAATRSYLNAHADINVVIWSWCGEVSGASVANIETYLSLMSALERDFPNVRFVYMTGHLDGSGLEGNLHLRNEQIRTYCRDNDKALFDFADIETYDPDDVYYGDKYPTDGCDYDGNGDGSQERNWARDWQASHVEGVDWYSCGAAHTEPLNANRKAYAAWSLWARLAGWSGGADPALAVADARALEGSGVGGRLTFAVTLSEPATQDVTVDYMTLDGTALAPSDYLPASGTLTLAAGVTAAAVEVQLVGDTLDEPDERLTLHLSNPTHAVLRDADGSGTVVDDDDAPALSIGDASLLEGDSGVQTLSFPVQLSAPSSRTVTVGYATADGTATSGVDYTRAAGTLTFAAGETAGVVDVRVVGDRIVERDETFYVRLSRPSGATLGDGQAVGTIINDDVAGISISDTRVTEGRGAIFVVTLAPARRSAVFVNWATEDGSAVAPQDYFAASGRLTFPAGTTTRTIVVRVRQDTLPEPDETFSVRLSRPTAGIVINDSGVGQATVINRTLQ
jgi:hypothetical protein